MPMDMTTESNGLGRGPLTMWPLVPEPSSGVALRRLALVTDAWRPQTNGVVNTLVRLVKYLESQGIEVLVISPDAHRTLPLPSYPEIHVATEGPLGFWAVGWLRRSGLRFTTSFHTRYAEYVSARLPVPLEWGYHL